MNGFMITTDYGERNGAFDHNCVVVNMYDDTRTVLDKITDEGREIVKDCDNNHPMVVCLHLSVWTSHKTVQRLYTILPLFRDTIRDTYGINVIIDFTTVTAETLSRLNLLRDFQILAGSSLDVKEYPTEE